MPEQRVLSSNARELRIKGCAELMLCEGFHSVFVTLAEASHMSTPVTAGQDALVWRGKEYVERTVTLPKDPFCKDTRLGYRKYTGGGRLEQTEEKDRFSLTWHILLLLMFIPS